MSVPLLVIKVHIFRIISLSIARKQKSMIELQTSVKQDDTTRTRTPKPGYLNLSNDNQWIVSAAHCFHGDRNVDNYKITVGMYLSYQTTSECLFSSLRSK